MVRLLTPFSLTGLFDDFSPSRCADRRLERQCNELGLWATIGRFVNRSSLHQLDGSGAGWSAALQPGLQHQQHG